MKTSYVAAATVMAAAACTASDDGLSSKQLLASEIRYDNGGGGLVSTNVQDAIDDVVAMAQASDERMARAVITCKFATSNLELPVGGVVPHVFTAAECGGTLPDARYVGAIAKIKTCSSALEGIEVMNAGEPDGPGIVLRKTALGEITSCSGAAALVAVFYRAS
jgi:hypothetical protein